MELNIYYGFNWPMTRVESRGFILTMGQAYTYSETDSSQAYLIN